MQTQYFAIGLMSGTSLDGLDLCYAKFVFSENWSFEIIHAETIPYSTDWHNKLKNAVILSAEDLLALDKEYGFFLGQKTLECIEKNKIKDIDLIASHGHTVFHQPQRKFTLQIGDGRAIKLRTGIETFYDFRSQDVLMGGNGAPLVPIGDELLFSKYDACLNLGGFSNISFKQNEKRIAFDISPVNIVLNHLAEKLGKPYDQEGLIAKKGKVNMEILAQLNALTFYQQNPPKSLGAEWVFESIFPLIKNDTIEKLIATFTEHVASQIAVVTNEYGLNNVLVTGGGAYNTYLIESIQKKTNTQFILPAPQIIEYKEALIFAFMGVLKSRNEINVLSSSTGSSKDHSAGLQA